MQRLEPPSASAPSGPLVSVVIASYNMAAFLPLAVRSALDQTYWNLEVLVVDDGSQDDTRQVMGQFLGEPRVRYLTQTNLGQASAKNHGVREAKGDYVAFLDADDVWESEKLQLQVPLFLRSAVVGVVYSRVAYMDEAGNAKGIADNQLFRGRVSGELLIRNFIGFGSAIVRRECFERLGGFDETIQMGIDFDLWLRFSTQYEFDYVDRPLLRYRVWSGQMSRNCKSRYVSGIAIMERFLERYPDAVAKSTENEAWAHTFVGYGHCVREVDRSAIPALRLYARALRYKVAYFPAWRAILTALLPMK